MNPHSFLHSDTVFSNLRNKDALGYVGALLKEQTWSGLESKEFCVDTTASPLISTPSTFKLINIWCSNKKLAAPDVGFVGCPCHEPKHVQLKIRYNETGQI